MAKPPAKPKVSINVAITADGKISTRRREPISLGSSNDRFLMDKLRSLTDAVIIGAGTLRVDPWAILVRDAGLLRKRLQRRPQPHPLNVVVSRRLNLPIRGEFFTHPDTQKLIITTRAAPTSRIERFKRLADVHVVRGKRIRPQDVLDCLATRGARRVLIEGGGELNFSFIKEGTVDEIYITVTPWLLGGRTAPTAVDGPGFLKNNHARLSLVSSRRQGDEVFLRYRFNKG